MNDRLDETSSVDLKGVTTIETEGVNSISYSDYIKRRDPTFDYPSKMRTRSPLVLHPDDQSNYPQVVLAYELALANINSELVPLWDIIIKAGQLINLFNNVDRFVKWYNNVQSGSDSEHLEVTHPRIMIHRAFDDLNNVSRSNGIVAMIENQSSYTLMLEDWISWYGWGEAVGLPAKVKSYETQYLNWVYNGTLYKTAAIGLRYSVGSSGWYAYICFYTSSLDFNYSFVCLSRDVRKWGDIYKEFKASASYSKPSESPVFINSLIDSRFRAMATAQVGMVKDESWITSLTDMFNPWKTPVDYRDEL
jgi:hypothetical protein